MDIEGIKTALRTWIKEEGTGKAGEPADDADILKDGHIDSLGLMGLMAYVEDLRDRPLADHELRMENFMSIDRIVRALFVPSAA